MIVRASVMLLEPIVLMRRRTEPSSTSGMWINRPPWALFAIWAGAEFAHNIT